MTKKYLLFETTAMFLSLNLLILLQKNMHPAGLQWFSFVSQFCFGFVPIQLYGYQGRPLSHLGFSTKKPLRQLLSAFLVLAAMAAYFLIFTLIAALLGTPFEYNFAGKISDVRVLAMQFIFQVFFVGFGEEILFRGYFLDRILSKSSSKKIAALITSILFGLVHFLQMEASYSLSTQPYLGLFWRMPDCGIKTARSFPYQWRTASMVSC